MDRTAHGSRNSHIAGFAGGNGLEMPISSKRADSVASCAKEVRLNLLMAQEFGCSRLAGRDFAMELQTAKFGRISIEPDDILQFPHGLIGFEQLRHWVLLSDSANDAVAWLQSVNDTTVALPVVSPRQFLPKYRVCATREQLDSLELRQLDQAFVLVVVAKTGESLTANLKAPVIINLDRQLGRQVVTSDEQPLQMELDNVPLPLRKSA